MSQTWRIAIANQAVTDIDRKIINGVVSYGVTHPSFEFRDIRFLNEGDVPARLKEKSYDGAIINMTHLDFATISEELPEIPMVNVGSDYLSKKIPSVRGVRGEGSRILTTHLRQLGFRRFAYVDYLPLEQQSVRASILKELLVEEGESFDRFYLPGHELEVDDVGIPPGFTEWLQQSVDSEVPAGVITYDGFRAAMVVEACRKMELNIPEAVGIATYVESRACLTCSPAITCVDSPNYEIGYAAMRLMHDMLQGQRHPRKPVEIAGGTVVVRGSTAAPDVFRDEIALAIEYMEKNFTSQITIGECLAHLGTVSRSSFYRSFTAQVGVAPGTYLRNLKVKHAKDLLISTPFSVSHVAQLAGFTSLEQLDNTFKLVVGKTPSQYRQSMKGNLRKEASS